MHAVCSHSLRKLRRPGTISGTPWENIVENPLFAKVLVWRNAGFEQMCEARATELYFVVSATTRKKDIHKTWSVVEDVF